MAVLLLLITLLVSVPVAGASSSPAPPTLSLNQPEFQAGPTVTYSKWDKVEITLTGPASVGMSDSQNPFLIDVSVAFTAPAAASLSYPPFTTAMAAVA